MYNNTHIIVYARDDYNGANTHLLDVSTQDWKQVPVSEKLPEMKYVDFSFTVGECLYLIDMYNNNIYAHNINNGHLTDISQQVVGEQSPVAYGRAYCSSGGGEVFVFGGECYSKDIPPTSSLLQGERVEEGNYHNQLHTLTTSHNTVSWAHPQCTGVHPQPRRYSCATVVGEHLYLFGGDDASWTFLNDLHTLHLPTLVWSNITCGGSVPRGRMRSALAPFDAHTLILCGGYDGRGSLNDVWLYHIELQQWLQQHNYTHIINSHTLVHIGVGGQVIKVGGWESCGKYCTDVVMFTADK